MARTQTAESVRFPHEQVTLEGGAAAFTETAQESTAAFTEAAEVLTSTASAIWEKQLDLLRIEVEQAQQRVTALTGANDPGAALDAYVSGVQGSIQTVLTDLRDINDLMRGCAWRLLGLYAQQMHRSTALFAERRNP